MGEILKELSSLRGNKNKSLQLIKENKAKLIEEKKRMPKNHVSVKADASRIISPEFDSSALKLEDGEVFIVGNSVGFFDSHQDVSLKGSWTKTANEQGTRIPIVKDHVYKTDNLFAKNLGVFIMSMPIKALGYDREGETEVIGAKIKPYSGLDYEKYTDKTITQHSMGLRYIKIDLAVNDSEFEEEFELWQKYSSQVINIEEAEKVGYFWAVMEQKAMEFSSVVFASNCFTPAFTNKSLLEEPSCDTLSKKPTGNSSFYKKLIYST